MLRKESNGTMSGRKEVKKTLNINGLYTPIEGDCKNGLKNNLTIYVVYKTPF